MLEKLLQSSSYLHNILESNWDIINDCHEITVYKPLTYTEFIRITFKRVGYPKIVESFICDNYCNEAYINITTEVKMYKRKINISKL